MRSFVFLIYFFFASSYLIAGDIPCGATLLGTDNPDFISFDNTTASNSNVYPPPYGGYIGPDTWISFVMPSAGFYLVLNGTSMVDPAIAIYQGPCSDPKLLYNVLDNNCDGDPNPLLFIDELNAGEQYFIRVWAQDGSPNGVFEIKLLQTISGIPDFIAFADATIVGDCIELTQNTGTQKGCAWYQNAIDFTMPFTHEMTANFGTLDGNGADGICLVYQSNGQDFCGGTGEGIGAGGMPNSAIFEFDTYQNGNLADPAQDHCAFNINGNMNHTNSIEGPIELGNIEDGLDHTILFEWNPAGNMYSVYFDGLLVLSGSFDIINNCFGGSNTAYWGYTSATGGSTNLQVICPVVEVLEPSFTEYNEVDICAGESFMGHTDSGFYVDFGPGPNGCDYQFNTLLNVHELPEPEYLYEVVCEGEFILVANEVFTLPDLYEINTFTEFGCDSIIYLQLENIIPNLEIETPPLITCTNSSVELIPNPSSNFDITQVNYTWSGNQSTTNQDTLQVSAPGTYFLTAQITSNGKQCLSFTNVTVEIDTTAPILQNLSDVFLDCNNIDTDTLLYSSISGENIDVAWIFEDSIISQHQTSQIFGEGIYSVIVTDTINGCQDMDSLELIMSNDIPVIELVAEDLNCQITSFQPNFTTTGIIDSFLWTHDDVLFSHDSIPNIESAGSYMVTVISQDGCKSSASVNIKIDTLKPVVDIDNVIVPCDIQTTTLAPDIDQNFDVQWDGPNIATHQDLNITIIEEGWYHLTVTNPNNFCSASDSSFIQFKGDSPTLSLSNDTLNCYTPSTILDLSSNQSDLTYEWIFDSNIISTDEDILVNEEGWYIVNAINPNECNAIDSVYVHADFTAPEVDITFDTLNCIVTNATVELNATDGNIFFWSGPNNFQSTESSFTTMKSGAYILSVINDKSGCELKDTIEILNTSVVPEFDIDSDTLTCKLTQTELPFSISTPYLSLEWTGPNGFYSDSIHPNISMEGEYFVQIEFEGECSLDTSLIIHQNTNPPEYSLDYDSITCLSPFVTFNTIVEDEAVFSLTTPSGEIIFNTEYIGSESGEYIFDVEGINGCTELDTFHIEAYLDVPDLMINNVDPITCVNFETSISASSSDPNLNYNWLGPNGFASDDNSFATNEGGTYSLHVTNQYGCVNEEEIFVSSFLDPPEIEIYGDHISCTDQQSTIVINSQNDNLGKTWSGENSFIDLTDSIIVEKEGWYSLLVENQYGCTNKDSIFIEALIETPEIILVSGNTIEVNVRNPNSQIIIDVNSTVDYNVNWFPNIGISCDTCLNPIINSLDNLQYEVVVTNEYGCAESEFIQVHYIEELRVNIPNVFSPSNEDGANDFFTLYGNEKVALINQMLIYDRWGQLIAQNENFAPNDPSLGWNGKLSGRLVIPGVYAYVFQITTTSGEVLTYYGDISVI